LQKKISIFLIGRQAIFAVITLLPLLHISGCSRPPPPASSFAAQPTVASLSPAATDLIIGIGAANHLLAVSDYDESRPGTVGLPKVGNWNQIDWEKLAVISPKILVTQFGNRMPPDVLPQCKSLGIQVIDVRLDNLSDIYHQADVLGKALGEQPIEKANVRKMQDGLAAIAKSVAGLPKIRTAIAVFDDGRIGLIGPNRFHDDLLTIAGGINVADKFHNPFIDVDGEQLTALAPDVILDLQPIPPTTPQEIQQDQRFWKTLPDVPAVKNGRVFRITAPYAMRPGWHAVQLTETFAQKLHGK